MKKGELTAKIGEAFEGYDFRDFEVKFLNHDPVKGTLTLRVQQMYEYVEVTFANLEKLSTICGTTSIDVGEKDARGGCESCDYGSCYMVDFHLKNFWMPLEEDDPKENTKRR